MNEVVDFEETESLNEDIFDCEYTSVDAVINEVTVFTGCKERQTENGTRTLIYRLWRRYRCIRFLY